jgi:hypothetical protein
MAEPRLNPYLAFSVPAMGNAGLSCLGVFELAAAIQPLRGITPAQAGIILRLRYSHRSRRAENLRFDHRPLAP